MYTTLAKIKEKLGDAYDDISSDDILIDIEESLQEVVNNFLGYILAGGSVAKYQERASGTEFLILDNPIRKGENFSVSVKRNGSIITLDEDKYICSPINKDHISLLERIDGYTFYSDDGLITFNNAKIGLYDENNLPEDIQDAMAVLVANRVLNGVNMTPDYASKDAKSETIGSYSITYGDNENALAFFGNDVLATFNRYKRQDLIV